MFGGIVVVVAAGAYYLTKNKSPLNKGMTIGGGAGGPSQVDTSALSKNYKGYGGMMKIPPEYYNNTSTEGKAFYTNSFAPQLVNEGSWIDNNNIAPWVLPAEQGNGSMVSPGWQQISDQYSAVVSNNWKQNQASLAHN